jgi:hypothetical protein
VGRESVQAVISQNLRNRVKYNRYFKQKFNYLIEKFDRQ